MPQHFRGQECRRAHASRPPRQASRLHNTMGTCDLRAEGRRRQAAWLAGMVFAESIGVDSWIQMTSAFRSHGFATKGFPRVPEVPP
jgi:hypothetical protein